MNFTSTFLGHSVARVADLIHVLEDAGLTDPKRLEERLFVGVGEYEVVDEKNNSRTLGTIKCRRELMRSCHKTVRFPAITELTGRASAHPYPCKDDGPMILDFRIVAGDGRAYFTTSASIADLRKLPHFTVMGGK